MKHNKGNIKLKNKSNVKIKECNLCNPTKYLKIDFSFISHESNSVKNEDIINAWNRLRFISSKPYYVMQIEFSGNKGTFFEAIPTNLIKKDIPTKFRDFFPSETNEVFNVLRVYPSGRPSGSANPRIIGMIKHHVFYIFYLDWDGKLYKH